MASIRILIDLCIGVGGVGYTAEIRCSVAVRGH